MDTSQSSPNDLHHEGNVVPRASKPSPTAVELGKKLALLLGLPPVIEIGTRGVIMDASQSPPPNDRGHEVDVVPLVSKDSPTTEGARSGEPLPKAQYNSSDQHIAMAPETSEFTAHYRQWSRSSLGLPVEPFLVGPKELPAAKEARSGVPARDPQATRNSSNQSLRMDWQRSELPPGLRVMEASIGMSPRPSGLNDQSASDKPSAGRRIYRGVARIFILALIAAFIGVAASYWQSHRDKALELARTYASSLGLLSSEWPSRGTESNRMVATWAASLLDWLFPVPTKPRIDINIAAKQPDSAPAGQASTRDAAPQQSASLPQKPVPAAASISPELVQQLEAMARDLSVLRHEVEQLATAQEQMTHNIASPQAAQQNIEQNKSPPPLSAVHVPPATQEQMTHNISSPQAAQPDVRQKKLSSPLSPAVRLPPPKNPPGAAPRQPPARVAVLADWWIPDGPGDGWVYVQGHGDVYRVVPGTPLPGLGPVEQIKGQNGHWVVVTSKGIILPRRDPLSGGERDVLERDRANPDDNDD